MANVSDVYTIYANTGQLEEATRKVGALTTKIEDTGKANAKAAMGFNALAQGFEDLQYSVGGAMNNLSQVAVMMGAGGAVVAGVTLTGVALNQLVKHWGDLTDALGLTHAAHDATISKLEGIAAATKQAADATGEYTDRILANQAALTASLAKNPYQAPLAEFGMEDIRQQMEARGREAKAAKTVEELTGEESGKAGKQFADSIKEGLAEGETGQTLINAISKALVEEGIAGGQIQGDDPRQFAAAANAARASVREMMSRAGQGDTQAAADLGTMTKRLTAGGFDGSGILGRFQAAQEWVGENWEKRIEADQKKSERRTEKRKETDQKESDAESDWLNQQAVESGKRATEARKRREEKEKQLAGKMGKDFAEDLLAGREVNEETIKKGLMESQGLSESDADKYAAGVMKQLGKGFDQSIARGAGERGITFWEELARRKSVQQEGALGDQLNLASARLNLRDKLFGGPAQRIGATDFAREAESKGADYARQQVDLMRAFIEEQQATRRAIESQDNLAVLSR